MTHLVPMPNTKTLTQVAIIIIPGRMGACKPHTNNSRAYTMPSAK